ncbi:TPR-like protein [Wolfiporia cocos MD-104 SS10]|uniref:TPR-like protein n=1 Tax=Wolfiporia cocos (strain MD-104) TaxID=742152 RepID=A0A2H3JNN8_WOLCO|nr:TPR-like protein [Wolfiporia cocos MD-104 SS10]
MSLPMLVNGADCGPVNPLQGLSKRFDQDRGVQQDHFGAGRAGSSKEGFRSQYSAAAGSSQDAARFFASAQPSSPITAGPSSFDLSALHADLPSPFAQPHAALTPQRQTPLHAASWAADFLQQPGKQSPLSPLSPSALAAQAPQLNVQQENSTHVQSQLSPGGLGFRPFSPMTSGYGMTAPVPLAAPQFNIPVQSPSSLAQIQASQWDQEFRSQEASLSEAGVAYRHFADIEHQAEQAQQAQSQNQQHEADELARTAGRLIETVQHEQNPKFKNSEFMSLMRQLRDGEVVVDGDKMVPNDPQSGISASSDLRDGIDTKGKGRADYVTNATNQASLRSFNYVPVSYLSPEQTQAREADAAQGYGESPIDAYLREENERYIEVTRQAQPERGSSKRDSWMDMYGPDTQDADWGRLQRDWNAFEATATGIRPLAHYQFQAHNPYVLGEASRTRHHALHAADAQHALFENVLELEAAVQRESGNALRWFELGVKQQENEREQKAVQALRRALELDPAHLPSWLALAVSHTNEGNRHGTYAAIREWVDRNERYSDQVQRFRALNPEEPDATQRERFQNLIQCLIYMAQGGWGGEIDADIQIALAVLMNTNEEYSKAQDCFNTALAVRPNDWLLYNRVGATMANSGQPEQALQYYYRALELNPGYIRARYNLGISCINMRRYEEAAHHILDALVLQDGDSVHERDGGAADKRGVTSQTLWQSLKTCCMHMQKLDLANFCDREDLEAFRLHFQT